MCLQENPGESLPIAMQVHERSREAFSLPIKPPKALTGVPCSICSNECRIPEGEVGYCGLRINVGGRLTGVSSEEGKFSWYYDHLPTNCVADWVCPGGTGAGYPKYANCPGPEYGYKNLAVFFYGCSFNCLYCQNWHFKRETFRPGTSSAESLISAVIDKNSCICYFGGDPTPQLPFALNASRHAIKKAKDRILRICWETNGSMNPNLLEEMLKISMESGGILKFDLKALDTNLHKALTGISNKRTLENFREAAKWLKYRSEPPIIMASTLLVPGYIEEKEVRSIARFIATIDPQIPYSLLAFYPHFYMQNLPLIKKSLARRCLAEAQDAGLDKVRLGNEQLLI